MYFENVSINKDAESAIPPTVCRANDSVPLATPSTAYPGSSSCNALLNPFMGSITKSLTPSPIPRIRPKGFPIADKDPNSAGTLYLSEDR
eukprot:CAMPEP_0197190830 /NCGR_PEP_ID=MMETSP1423-20130617/22336_1 /TAXON_ID=476441 /ORGANISM="Pseudo-nitzschia heimii, Strain UNC1101" /LENGTH=89 /DNA_ID=CAMNT_0042643297 /DNA_START=751 /DNA_END=1020 /DNA_ORIENTATION=+